MNPQLKSAQQWFNTNRSLMQGVSAPIMVMTILAMMVLPMPAWLLDTFFTLSLIHI